MDRKQVARERALKWRKEHPFPQWFIEDLEGSPDKDAVLGCYLSVNDYALFYCKACNEFYRQKITHHLNRGDGCPACASSKRASSLSNTIRSKREYKNIDYLRTATNWKYGLKSYDILHFVCPVHGPYDRTVYRASHYPGCKRCNYSASVTSQNKENRLRKEIPSFILDELADQSIRDSIICGDIPLTQKQEFVCSHGHKYFTRFTDRLNGHGCPTCGASSANWVSSLEVKLAESLRLNGVEVIQSCRTEIVSPVNGRPMELDLYLPEYKLAVEVNGLYYHSYERMVSVNNYQSLEDKTKYHLTKFIACQNAGIRLISLWEDSIRDKFDVCINLILSKIGKLKRIPLGARKTKVEFTDGSLFEKYHIQGKGRGDVISLVYSDVVVASIQVRKSPSNEDFGSYILDRYVSHPDYFVVGGIEKLMRFAEGYYSIPRWVSFADRMTSDGSLYRRLGFEEICITPVSWWCIFKSKRYHKFNFRKSAFARRDDLQYKEGLTEFELYALNNVTRVYDCGKIKFSKQIM